MKHEFKLSFTETGTIAIEAETRGQALEIFNAGDWDGADVEPDEELNGGIPWDLVEDTTKDAAAKIDAIMEEITEDANLCIIREALEAYYKKDAGPVLKI